ncbi:MAG: hypothetical protein V7L21_05370 [Nostoc sp.]|uniref:hypothetical protein n=1 Tax=unclassified Nostoc TaxID=2593658 RepID=UPI0025F419A9|nr:hypothetical protein [Nostoc sp. NMS9]MBN3944698.1 hypothetical protein [Nostoc sp. NMS9]
MARVAETKGGFAMGEGWIESMVCDAEGFQLPTLSKAYNRLMNRNCDGVTARWKRSRYLTQ